jgi:hypothetical protein
VRLVYQHMGRKGLEGIESVGPRLGNEIETLLDSCTSAILILGYGECAKRAETLSSCLGKQLQGARLWSGSRGWPAEKRRVGQLEAVTG